MNYATLHCNLVEFVTFSSILAEYYSNQGHPGLQITNIVRDRPLPLRPAERHPAEATRPARRTHRGVPTIRNLTRSSWSSPLSDHTPPRHQLSAVRPIASDEATARWAYAVGHCRIRQRVGFCSTYQLESLTRRRSAPDSVWLTGIDCVATACVDHRTLCARKLCVVFDKLQFFSSRSYIREKPRLRLTSAACL